MRIGLALDRVISLVGIVMLLPVGHSAAQASESLLFAEPLHLTREVADPLSGSTAKIEEYCIGNRVVSVRETRTSIADYGRGELTEIDRTKGTYSLTSFDAIARALPEQTGVSAKRPGGSRAIELTDAGVRPVGVRGGRAFEATIGEDGSSRKVEVVVDQQLKVSRAALEVLVGAAFPLRRTEESEIAIEAAGRDRAGAKGGPAPERDHALPLEQSVIWNVEGETLRFVNRVIRVGNEPPPPELIAIPAGARLVESEIVVRKKLLDELDRLPSAGAAREP